jgi:hypothetical protein
MMSLVKDSRRALGALGMTLLFCWCVPANAQVAESTAQRALVLNLATTDLDALADGIRAGFFSDAISGRFDEPISSDHWFGTVSVRGIRYSFRLNDIAIVPQSGRLAVAVSLSQVRIVIDRIDFNESGSRHCVGMPLSSGGYAIGGSASVAPFVHERELVLLVPERHVELNDDNFNAEQPAACDVAWGFNWIISRAMPWVVERARGVIADAIAERVALSLQEFGKGLNDYLAVGITWPFDLPPAPPFYATASLWPTALTVDPDGAQFVLGADVTFDPDHRGWRDDNEAEAWWLTRPRAHVPSYLGIGKDLFQAILSAANAGGLFTAYIDQTVWPVAADVLTAGGIAPLLPDLATRFEADEPVLITMSGAVSTATTLRQEGQNADMDFKLNGLRVALSVRGEPYYSFAVDTTIRLSNAYDPSNRNLSLTWSGLELVHKGGAFAPNLTPPVSDTRFVAAALPAWTKSLYTRLQDAGDGPGLTIPEIGLGGYVLTPEGVSVRGDVIALDARLLRP